MHIIRFDILHLYFISIHYSHCQLYTAASTSMSVCPLRQRGKGVQFNLPHYVNRIIFMVRCKRAVIRGLPFGGMSLWHKAPDWRREQPNTAKTWVAIIFVVSSVCYKNDFCYETVVSIPDKLWLYQERTLSPENTSSVSILQDMISCSEANVLTRVLLFHKLESIIGPTFVGSPSFLIPCHCIWLPDYGLADTVKPVCNDHL